MGIISAIVGSVYPLKGISVKLSRVGYKPLSSPPVDRLCNELALISTQPLTARQMLNFKHQQ
ncbi:hypothetical protein D7W34_18480 [Escherichia coli]|nr:hypothetical protein [Escherichia coli]